MDRSNSPFGQERSIFTDGIAWLKSLIGIGPSIRMRGLGDEAYVQNPAQYQGQTQAQNQSQNHANQSHQGGGFGGGAPKGGNFGGGSGGRTSQFGRSARGNGPGFQNVNFPSDPSGKKSGISVQIVIAIVVAAIPLGFYVFQPGEIGQALEVIMGEDVSNKRNTNKITNTSSANSASKQASQKNVRPMKVANSGSNSQNGRNGNNLGSSKKGSALDHAVKHSNPKFVCPMHSSVIDDDPNSICPICGMDLVLLETGGESGIVKLTPTVINSLGVRTAKVRRRTLYRRIDSVGYINIDENNQRAISLRTDGWVENLAVKSMGERVTKGQLLMEIYSPKLVNAQEEYVQAKTHKNDLLLGASRERLRALGVSDEQITELDASGKVEHLVKVFSPQPGIVSELNIREGMYVKPTQSVASLVDLSSVWLMVDVFERQADWVKVGQRAEASLPFMPDKTWEGTVDYVYPSLSAATRSLKVRLRFDNVDENLKPNMYADVTIYARPKKKALTIPTEALIRTGSDKRVIIALGEGRFMPMKVSVGVETGSKIEILNGLSEGDVVVTSSQFLIDSESSLKASLARMAGG